MGSERAARLGAAQDEHIKEEEALKASLRRVLNEEATDDDIIRVYEFAGLSHWITKRQPVG